MKIKNFFTEYEVKEISKVKAKEFIVKFHYTHTFPLSVLHFGAFKDDELIGVIVYGMSCTPKMAQSIVPYLGQSDYLELQRLFVKDCTESNFESWFIAQTVGWIKKNKPQIKLLVSFSDSNYGHVGTVYQATNWLYVGNTKPASIWLNSNGIVVHSRTITKGKKDKSSLIKVGRPPKYRYVLFLTKGIDIYKNTIDNSIIRCEDLDYWVAKEKNDGIIYIERINGNFKKYKTNFKKDLRYKILEYPKKQY